jgi:23S rRNA (guanine745-N1)-methyltransferase
VRGCTLPLQRRDRTLVCSAGHSFDIARSGYVNLLQPQDRRSDAAGDSRASVEARESLLMAGVGRTLIDSVSARAAALELSNESVVLDVGCGSGDALAAMTESRPGIGLDLSIPAIERAARRFPDRTWVVANADRRLPFLDRSIALAVSLHARRNPAEAARVLIPQGHLLVAVPAADDLIELRELVQGERVERDRASLVVTEHEPLFRWSARRSISIGTPCSICCKEPIAACGGALPIVSPPSRACT